MPVYLIGLVAWGIVSFPGWFYPLHGWGTMAVIAGTWMVAGLIVGWLFDRAGRSSL